MPEWLSRFDGRLDARPPLTPAQLAEVPARRGVLCLLAEGDVPLLLITAVDLRARLRGRLAEIDPSRRTRAADLRAVTRRILWKTADSSFEADWLFLESARAMRPEGFAPLLSWKPAWFVHVDAEATWPLFRRTRAVPAGPGQYLGPFPDGRRAEQFIQVLQDAFDLCRRPECLRQSPHGQRCAYAQIGRCLCPCDGSIPMDRYRQVVAEAADFAAGQRQAFADALRRRMKAAAAELQFEKAGAFKTRLDRLAELDHPAYAFVAPLEQFRFILVQAGPSRHQVKVFLADRGAIEPGGLLEDPLRREQLERVTGRMAALAGGACGAGEVEQWGIGLVAHYLFASEARRGVIERWSPNLSPDDLERTVEAARKRLRLSPPRGAAPPTGSLPPAGGPYNRTGPAEGTGEE